MRESPATRKIVPCCPARAWDGDCEHPCSCLHAPRKDQALRPQLMEPFQFFVAHLMIPSPLEPLTSWWDTSCDPLPPALGTQSAKDVNHAALLTQHTLLPSCAARPMLSEANLNTLHLGPLRLPEQNQGQGNNTSTDRRQLQFLIIIVNMMTEHLVWQQIDRNAKLAQLSAKHTHKHEHIPACKRSAWIRYSEELRSHEKAAPPISSL